MKASNYVYFNGNCKEAFQFYTAATGGDLLMMMTYDQMPAQEQTSPELAGKIVHARIKLGDSSLMGADAPPDRYSRPQGFSVSLDCDTPEEAERIYAALSEGGGVFMPMSETFFAARFSMFTDKFGVPWMVMCENRS